MIFGLTIGDLESAHDASFLRNVCRSV